MPKYCQISAQSNADNSHNVCINIAPPRLYLTLILAPLSHLFLLQYLTSASTCMHWNWPNRKYCWLTNELVQTVIHQLNEKCWEVKFSQKKTPFWNLLMPKPRLLLLDLHRSLGEAQQPSGWKDWELPEELRRQVSLPKFSAIHIHLIKFLPKANFYQKFFSIHIQLRKYLSLQVYRYKYPGDREIWKEGCKYRSRRSWLVPVESLWDSSGV